ncbi:MAG: hypothetical protein HOE90_18375 [Bacteriovoracaceae bacterium]|nr:hypothetical protein [Bacteriovoracaceae bacterium]
MKMFFLLCSASLIMVSSAFSDTPLLKPPGKVSCHDGASGTKDLNYCLYVTQNISASKLKSKLSTVMFSGGTFATVNIDDVLHADGQELTFWLEKKEDRTRLISLIPLLDTFKKFSSNDLVKIVIDVYRLTESAVSDIQASPSNALGTAAAIFTGAKNPDLLSVLSPELNLGTDFLSSILFHQKTKGEVVQIDQLILLIPNGDSINFSRVTNNYVETSSTGSATEEVGISLNGTVQISEASENLLKIDSYSMNYGVLGEVIEDRVTKLSFSREELYLAKGVSTLLFSAKNTFTSKSKSFGFSMIGKSKEKYFNKLMISLTAEPVSFDKFIEESEKMAEIKEHGKLPESAVAELSENKFSLNQALGNIKPYVFKTMTGDLKLGFTVDSAFATKKNITKDVEIEVKGGGMKLETILELQNLMTTGLEFKGIQNKYFAKSYFEIEVTLKKFSPHKKSKTEEVTHTLYFNPTNMKFMDID